MSRPLTTPPNRMNTRSRVAMNPDGRLSEPIAHPLFSSVYIPASTMPNEAVFFGYGQGDFVPGFTTVLARSHHTNLPKGGTLSEPQTFIASGIRVHVSALAWSTAGVPSLADASVGTTIVNDDNAEDLANLLMSAVLTFEHQDQTVVEEPAIMCPSNYYMDGVAATSQSAGSTAAAQSLTQLSHIGTKGLARSFGRYAQVIGPAEQFAARLEWKLPKTVTITDGKLVYCILDGQWLRAVR